MHITTVEQAQAHIKQIEDKWIKIKNILSYLGIKNGEIMKPQEDMLNKWISTYNFTMPLIQKACDICFERLNRADFKYIDGILSNWYKNNIKTFNDLDSYFEKQEWEVIEDEIAKLEEDIETIEAQMQENASDYGKLAELQRSLDEANENLLEKYERYEYLSDLAE